MQKVLMLQQTMLHMSPTRHVVRGYLCGVFLTCHMTCQTYHQMSLRNMCDVTPVESAQKTRHVAISRNCGSVVVNAVLSKRRNDTLTSEAIEGIKQGGECWGGKSHFCEMGGAGVVAELADRLCRDT
jgi:hypothetical protein